MNKYDEIDLDVVWETIVSSLPILVIELEKLISPEE
jgi:uncharacterized protein with HEPN domain